MNCDGRCTKNVVVFADLCIKGRNLFYFFKIQNQLFFVMETQSLPRKELYELVWSQAMLTSANHYQIWEC